jgi:hypothetical protein
MTPRQKFIIYIRTLQVFGLRLRSEIEEMQPVHISTKEIELRFFPFPKFKRKEEVQALIKAGEVLVTEKDKRFFYEVVKPGKIDLSLITTKPLPEDPIYQIMLDNLKMVSLPAGAQSTDYFDLYLKYKSFRPELFFKVDSFAGRVHSPISNFHRTHRPFLLLDGEQTTSLDVTCMQPTLLGKILNEALPGNEYSKWINEGKDIYIELQNKAILNTRDEAKKKFFEILFSKPSNALAALFGASDWITWINEYKSTEQPLNPHKDKRHSNLAWLLQSTEVKVMAQVWRKLIAAGIVFIPVHDEIIIPVSQADQARANMIEVLSKEFVYFKISDKAPPPVSILPIEIIELQKHYSNMEQSGMLDHHPQREQIGDLWQSVKTDYHTPQLQQHLTQLKNLVIA